MMYIVAIAWMYVVVLMAATQPSVLAGLGTFVFYGLVPCSVVMYVLMAPNRSKQRKAKEALEINNLNAPHKAALADTSQVQLHANAAHAPTTQSGASHSEQPPLQTVQKVDAT